MKILLKYIFRNIKSNLLRTIIILMSVAISCSLFYVCLNIRQDMLNNANNLYKDTVQGFDLIYYGDLDELEEYKLECNETYKFRADYGEYNDKPCLFISGKIDDIFNHESFALTETIDDFDFKKFGYAVMTKANAQYLGLNLGDTFYIPLNEDAQKKFSLKGITFTLAGFIDFNNLIHIPELDSQANILVYQDILENNCEIMSFVDNRNIVSIASTLKLEIENSETIILVDPNDFTYHFTIINSILLIVLMLVLLLSTYLIINSQSIIITYRLSTIGTFRSIGVSNFESKLLLYFESLFYGFLSFVPGIIIGELIRININSYYLNLHNQPISILILILVLIFTLVLCLINTHISILKYNKVSIKDMIFNTQLVKENNNKYNKYLGISFIIISLALYFINNKYFNYNLILSIISLLFVVIGLSFIITPICKLTSKLLSKIINKVKHAEIWLGIKNIQNNKLDKSSTTLLSIVVCLVFLIYICISSITSFYGGYKDRYPSDIIVKFAKGDESSFSFLNNIEGIEKVQFEYWDGFEIYINDELHKIYIADIETSSLNTTFYCDTQLNNNEAIIDSVYANNNGIKIGDTIQYSHTLDRKVYNYFEVKVVGFCNSTYFNSGRNTAYISHDFYIENIKTYPEVIEIYIKENYNIQEVKEEIQNEFNKYSTSSVMIATSEEYINEDFDIIFNIINIVTSIPYIALILSLFGLINNQLLLFYQKKKLYSILYSTCMSKGQIIKMVITEIVISSLIGACIGIIVSPYLMNIMNNVIHSLSIFIDLQINITHLISIFGLVIVSILLTIIFPIFKLKRMNTVEELKYE